MNQNEFHNLVMTINRFSKDFFQKDYLNYLNEFDVHADLLIYLRRTFNNLNRRIYLKDRIITDNKINFNNFSIVRSEYYIQYSKVDIAILDTEEFKDTVNSENGNTLYGEKVDCAIEIKLQAFNDAKDVRADITKLKNLHSSNNSNDRLINYGISLLFSHSSDTDENISYLLKNNNYSVFDESKNYDFNIASLLVTPEKVLIRDCSEK